jgi:hypothetical protein
MKKILLGIKQTDKALKGIFFLSICFVSGCSILTKPQLETIKIYAVATQEYAQYPGLLIKDYVEIQNNIFLISSPLISHPDRAAQRLLSHHKDKNAILGEAEKLDLSFDILKEYAKSMEILANPDYFQKVHQTLDNSGTNLDHLIESYNSKFDKKIPAGLGGLVYQSLVLGSKTYLDQKRGQLLKEYIMKGEPIIREISEFTKKFLEEKVGEEWIKDIDLELESSHSAIRKHILVDTLSYSSNAFSLIHLDTKVSDIYDDIHQLKQLNTKLIASIDELYLAHQALNQDVQKKRKSVTVLGEVSAYVREVYGIFDLYQNLSQE